MNLITLITVVSSSLSGGLQEAAVANRVEYAYENADTILMEYIEDSELDSFVNVSSNEQEIIIKEVLLEFNTNNNLIDDDLADVLLTDIENSKQTEITTNNGLYPESENINSEAVNMDNILAASAIASATFIKAEKVLNVDNDQTLGYLYEDPARYEGAAGYVNTSSYNLLPIYEISSDINLSVNVNGKSDEYTFIGIEVSKETCIAFYNKVARFLNNLVRNAASGLSGAASKIIDIIITSVPKMGLKAFGSTIAAYLSSIWSSFLALFSAGPVGIIIGIIITIIVVSVILIVAYMLYCGYKQKGFRMGWEIYNLFDWRWVFE